MDNLFQSLETFYEKNETDDQKEKTIYDELAEKEEALFLAAKFGEKLLEEKEQLENQIEALKKDYQNHIEILEQEKYELKIIIDTLKNEYENKINELNEDIQMINQQLMHHQSLSALKLNENQRYIELIQELNEKNQCLNEQLKSVCILKHTFVEI
jgi:chromosome segregation ATPase